MAPHIPRAAPWCFGAMGVCRVSPGMRSDGVLPLPRAPTRWLILSCLHVAKCSIFVARGPSGLLLSFFSSSGFFLFFFRVPTLFLAGHSFFLLAPRCAACRARPHARTEIPALFFFLLASHCAARHARLYARAFPSLRTDDQRTNDATCGPQAWLTGRLHDGGIRSVRSPLRRAPLLATPIAKPLQCGRP